MAESSTPSAKEVMKGLMMKKKSKDEDDEKGWSLTSIRLAIAFTALLFSLPTIYVLYNFFFPNYPPRMSTSDSALIQKIFFGGEPAVILCEEKGSMETAGPAVLALARELSIPSYRLDCSVKLGSGKHNTYERMSVEAWNPTAFVVANGRKVQQLPPSFQDEKTLSRLAKSLTPRIRARHTRVDNAQDLTQCLGAPQSCILVYNSKPKSLTAAEVAPAVAAYRASTIALLDSSSRSFGSPGSPLLEGFFREELSVARTGSVGGNKDGKNSSGKGTVLIALRRVGQLESGGGSANILATVRAAKAGGLGLSDFESLFTAQRTALDALKALAGGAGGKTGAEAADAAVDAALAREETLQKLGSVLVSRESLTIDRVLPKAPPPQQQQNNNEGSQQQETAASPPPETLEELASAQRAKEAEARRRMAEEEASSPHVAHAVEEEEEGGVEAGGGGGGWARGGVEGE